MTEAKEYPYRPPRQPLMAEVPIRVDGIYQGDAMVRNLSADGLCGNGFVLHPGHPVSIFLSGIGDVRGRIIWSQGLRFGVLFERQIDVSDFDVTGDLRGQVTDAFGRGGGGFFRAA